MPVEIITKITKCKMFKTNKSVKYARLLTQIKVRYRPVVV